MYDNISVCSSIRYEHSQNIQKIVHRKNYKQWTVDESYSLRSEAALQSDCMAADTSVSVVRWQQGEQAVAWVWDAF